MSKKPSKNSLLSAHVLNFIKSYVSEQTLNQEKDLNDNNETKIDHEIQSTHSTQSQYRSPLHSHDERELSLNTNLMQIDDTKPIQLNKLYE